MTRIPLICICAILIGCSSTRPPTPIGWPAIHSAVERGDYDAAAAGSVLELAGDYPSRSYAMWKWWEHSFGERDDYMKMSALFGQSLYTLYDQSDAEARRIITEVFRRPDFDLTRTGSELRHEVESASTR